MLYDGFDCVADYADDDYDTLLRYYVTPNLDENLMVYDDAGDDEEYFYVHDGLGTVRQIVDASQNVENTYDYEGFGSGGSQTENIYNRFRYTGREYDAEIEATANDGTGLYYYRARTYDSTIGAFTSRDPISVLNRYSYCHAKPIIFVDPMGTQHQRSFGGDGVTPEGGGKLDEATKWKFYNPTRVKTSDIVNRISKVWNSKLCGYCITQLADNVEEKINSEIGTDDFWLYDDFHWESFTPENVRNGATNTGYVHLTNFGDAKYVVFHGDSLDDVSDHTIIHESMHILLNNISLRNNPEEEGWANFMADTMTDLAASVRSLNADYIEFRRECATSPSPNVDKCCKLLRKIRGDIVRLTSQMDQIDNFNRSEQQNSNSVSLEKVMKTSGFKYDAGNLKKGIECIENILDNFLECHDYCRKDLDRIIW